MSKNITFSSEISQRYALALYELSKESTKTEEFVLNVKTFIKVFNSNKDFKNFTLWSQHLVLHTRESLFRFLQSVGFVQINIKGVQRYPLSNHMYWLANGKPGGHKSSLSLIESKSLNNEYEKALAKIDATDTLVAVAKVP